MEPSEDDEDENENENGKKKKRRSHRFFSLPSLIHLSLLNAPFFLPFISSFLLPGSS